MEEQWQWAQDILDKLHHDFGDKNGISYTVFYTSLKPNPNLLLIGDNPGGTEKDEKQTGLHHEGYHEYFEYEYPLAQKMKEIVFAGADLQQLLRDSVKINRIFFKSRSLSELFQNRSYNELYKYCQPLVETIIEKLKPTFILAESFRTFDFLSRDREVELKKEETGKKLLLKGVYRKDASIPVLGINHPSRASFHRITNEDWGRVNERLREILIKKH